MGRNHQGLAHRIAEAQRKEKASAKRLAHLARRQNKRKQTVIVITP
jgi:hypothetical protein